MYLVFNFFFYFTLDGAPFDVATSLGTLLSVSEMGWPAQKMTANYRISI